MTNIYKKVRFPWHSSAAHLMKHMWRVDDSKTFLSPAENLKLCMCHLGRSHYMTFFGTFDTLSSDLVCDSMFFWGLPLKNPVPAGKDINCDAMLPARINVRPEWDKSKWEILAPCICTSSSRRSRKTFRNRLSEELKGSPKSILDKNIIFKYICI